MEDATSVAHSYQLHMMVMYSFLFWGSYWVTTTCAVSVLIQCLVLNWHHHFLSGVQGHKPPIPRVPIFQRLIVYTLPSSSNYLPVCHDCGNIFEYFLRQIEWQYAFILILSETMEVISLTYLCLCFSLVPSLLPPSTSLTSALFPLELRKSRLRVSNINHLYQDSCIYKSG